MKNQKLRSAYVFFTTVIFSWAAYAAGPGATNPMAGIPGGGGAGTEEKNFGVMAGYVTNTFGPIGHLITAVSYIGGLAFFIGFVMKFKAHKDNPTQTPIGQAVVLLLVAVLLVFFPTFIKFAGTTLFGTGVTAGPGGVSITGTGS